MKCGLWRNREEKAEVRGSTRASFRTADPHLDTFNIPLLTLLYLHSLVWSGYYVAETASFTGTNSTSEMQPYICTKYM